MSSNCLFCSLPDSRVLLRDDAAIAFFDAFPLTEGHTLVIPKRHVSSMFELSPTEQASIWAFVGKVREHLQQRFNSDAFNIGINDGTAAGQTIGHAHIHIIPRRKGDMLDPRGGVRWIFPDKADYWSKK